MPEKYEPDPSGGSHIPESDYIHTQVKVKVEELQKPLISVATDQM